MSTRRYTVETVILSGKGWTTDLQSETHRQDQRRPAPELMALIGQKLDPPVLDTWPGA